MWQVLQLVCTLREKEQSRCGQFTARPQRKVREASERAVEPRTTVLHCARLGCPVRVVCTCACVVCSGIHVCVMKANVFSG